FHRPPELAEFIAFLDPYQFSVILSRCAHTSDVSYAFFSKGQISGTKADDLVAKMICPVDLGFPGKVGLVDGRVVDRELETLVLDLTNVHYRLRKEIWRYRHVDSYQQIFGTPDVIVYCACQPVIQHGEVTSHIELCFGFPCE